MHLLRVGRARPGKEDGASPVSTDVSWQVLSWRGPLRLFYQPAAWKTWVGLAWLGLSQAVAETMQALLAEPRPYPSSCLALAARRRHDSRRRLPLLLWRPVPVASEEVEEAEVEAVPAVSGTSESPSATEVFRPTGA